MTEIINNEMEILHRIGPETISIKISITEESAIPETVSLIFPKSFRRERISPDFLLSKKESGR